MTETANFLLNKPMLKLNSNLFRLLNFQNPSRFGKVTKTWQKGDECLRFFNLTCSCMRVMSVS